MDFRKGVTRLAKNLIGTIQKFKIFFGMEWISRISRIESLLIILVQTNFGEIN